MDTAVRRYGELIYGGIYPAIRVRAGFRVPWMNLAYPLRSRGSLSPFGANLSKPDGGTVQFDKPTGTTYIRDKNLNTITVTNVIDPVTLRASDKLTDDFGRVVTIEHFLPVQGFPTT